MTKDALQTIAIIAAIFMAAWTVSGAITANTAAIVELRGNVAELRGEVAELRGALFVHISGHGHPPVIAGTDSATESKSGAE